VAVLGNGSRGSSGHPHGSLGYMTGWSVTLAAVGTAVGSVRHPLRPLPVHRSTISCSAPGVLCGTDSSWAQNRHDDSDGSVRAGPPGQGVREHRRTEYLNVEIASLRLA